MNNPTAFPSPLLKFGSIAAKWSLRLAAMLWVIFIMVWGCLHFVIVPRINDSRPWIEELASKSMGLKVTIGNISVQSKGLVPTFSVQDVLVLDTKQLPALRIPSLVLSVSPQSLLKMGTEQLTLFNPELHIERTADGALLVAGIAVPNTPDSSNDPVSEWVFSQPEILVKKGTIHWTDAALKTAPLSMRDVDIELQNGVVNHALKLDATPPTHLGERMSVTAVFKEPFIGLQTGHWRHWKGQVYAILPYFDATPISPYLGLEKVNIRQGEGTARIWIDIQNGNIRGLTTDVALNDVSVSTHQDRDPIGVRNVTGRLGAVFQDTDIEYFTESLHFETSDGLQWPGGNLRFKTLSAQNAIDAGGVLEADKIDIAAVMSIARRLPLDDALYAMLSKWSVQGLIDQFEARWRGDFDQLQTYQIKGEFKQLNLSSTDFPKGIQGLNGNFDLTQNTGKATLNMRNGQLGTFGLLEEQTIAFDLLQAQLQWSRTAQGLEVQVLPLQFSNADVQGTAKLTWKGAEPSTSNLDLGQLDLQGTLSRLNLSAIHRYTPLALDIETRSYLRQSILDGRASDVKFRIKGDMNKFPFTLPTQGDLHVSANLQNVGFAFAPASIMPKDSLPWPALQQVTGQLEINHDELQIKDASGKVAGTSSLQFSKANANLKQVYGNGVLSISTDARGNLSETLQLINNSPLSDLMDHALVKSSATGNAEFKLKMSLPVMEPERANIQGVIDFPGNDLQWMPDIPRLTQTRGQLAFAENGLSTKNLQARLLGGDVRIQGGLRFSNAPNTSKSPEMLRIQGTITSAGLRQTREIDAIAQLGQFTTGSTSYTAVVGMQSGHPEITVTSNLTGMALTLPPPFNKPAESVLPTRLETSVSRSQDKLQLTMGKLASVIYERDISTTTPHVLRGAIAIGLENDESAPLPTEGVIANINIPKLNLDAWSQIANALQKPTVKPSQDPTVSEAHWIYVPTTVVLRSEQITMGTKELNNVVIGGARSGSLWRANLDANELSGYVEYLQPSGNQAGRLFARLARLSIGQSQAQSVETLLDEQPSSIPALDIVIQNFELRGKNLGRVDIEAVNRGTSGNREQPREWRLNRFNVSMPEAMLTASGNWTSINNASTLRRSTKVADRRRTVLNFKLDISDAGALLTRFGTEGVVRKGSGKVEGQLAWLGSPFTLDYGNLSGSFSINVENGQFLKADPGIAKLLGVLSLQALPRRLTLDFKDVFSEGFSFDFLRGDITIDKGIARTNNLQMKGINAAVLMEGQADITKETQNIKVVVIPELNAGSASLIATAINPVIGISTFLAQMILRRPLIEATTLQLMVDGTWLDPKVTRVDRNSAPAESKP